MISMNGKQRQKVPFPTQLLAPICVLILLVLYFTGLGPMDSKLLIFLSILPLTFLVVIWLARTASSVPFFLPGLLVFFKQNDAVISLLGDAPLIEILAVTVGVFLLFRLKRDHVHSTLSDASVIFISLTGLFFALVVSSINAVDPDRSVQHAATFGKDLIFACLIAFAIRNVEDLKAFTYWVIFSTSFSAAIIVFDYFNGATLFPTYEDANWKGIIRSGGASTESVPSVATMVLFGSLLAVVLAVRTPTGRWLFACAALLGGAAIIASISRSAMVTFVIAAFILLWRLRKEPIFFYVISVVSVLGVVVAFSLPQSVVSKFVALSVPSEDRTVSRRFSYQEIGIDLFKSAPFIGIGAGNYPVRYASDDFRFVSGRGTEPRPLHNIYLQFAAETGIIGGLAFLILILSIGAAFLRASRSTNETLRHHSEGLLLVFFAMCIQLSFLSSKSFLGLWILIGAAIAVSQLIARCSVSASGGSGQG